MLQREDKCKLATMLDQQIDRFLQVQEDLLQDKFTSMQEFISHYHSCLALNEISDSLLEHLLLQVETLSKYPQQIKQHEASH